MNEASERKKNKQLCVLLPGVFVQIVRINLLWMSVFIQNKSKITEFILSQRKKKSFVKYSFILRIVCTVSDFPSSCLLSCTLRSVSSISNEGGVKSFIRQDQKIFQEGHHYRKGKICTIVDPLFSLDRQQNLQDIIDQMFDCLLYCLQQRFTSILNKKNNKSS